MSQSVPRSRVRRAVALAALTLVGACRSAASHRQSADREVYAILEQRRAELGAGTTHFSIEPEPGPLREKLQRGEVLPPLDFVAALMVAAENSRAYQSEKESLYLKALDLTLARYQFRVQMSGTVGAALSSDPQNGDDASLDGGPTFRRVLGTGAAIVGSLVFSFVRDISTGDMFRLRSSFNLEVTQPLLAGFGERIAMEPLTQAERDVVYEVRSFERFRRTFAVNVASSYFAILQQADQVSNERVNMENLIVLRERNEALALAGRLSDIQVDQARQDELRSRNRIIQAEERLASLLDDFKLFLGLPVLAKIELDSSELGDLEVDETLDVSADLAITTALARRLDLQTSLDQVDDSQRRVEIAEDALRSVLDLRANVSGDSPTSDPAHYAKDDLSWTLGVEWDLPLDQLAERNDYRESLITLDRSRRSAEQLSDQIQADLRDSVRQAQTRLQSLQIQQGAVQLAERRIESTTLNLQAGRADTRDILEAQEALLEARNAATQARIDYHLSQLALWRDMELLRVDESGIRLERDSLGAPRQENP